MNESARYTFGTSPAAAERLRSIGDFFNPIADMHIRRFVKTRPEVAIDLGCGPGFTTAMLAGATRCRDTYGLDRSGEFLAGARQEFGQYTFLEHDVTQVPFPVTPDVMYCRFVRSHLKHPVEIINRWLTQLQPRGFLFVDELNDIDSRLPVFTTYLSMAESIIAEQGAALYVGETLSSGEYNAQVLLNEATTIEVSDRKAASWFLSNTKTIWRLNGYVHSRLSPGERQDIEHLLENIMTSRKTESHITWKLRRRIRISWC